MSIDFSAETLVSAVLGSLLAALVFVIIGGVAETVWPARPRPLAAVVFNLAYLAPASLIQGLMTPLAATLTTLAINRMGGGLIRLPDAGWGLAVGVAIYLPVMDFGEYVFHRAQHRLPWLWAMHSLHHSDLNYNVSTTVRHFWLDVVLKSFTVYLVVGLLFKTPPRVVTIYGVLTLYNYFVHMNVRVGFGRWAFALNSPQYHRLHHSNRLQDHDRTSRRCCRYSMSFSAPIRRRAPGIIPRRASTPTARLPAWRRRLLWPFSAHRKRAARQSPMGLGE